MGKEGWEDSSFRQNTVHTDIDLMCELQTYAKSWHLNSTVEKAVQPNQSAQDRSQKSRGMVFEGGSRCLWPPHSCPHTHTFLHTCTQMCMFYFHVHFHIWTHIHKRKIVDGVWHHNLHLCLRKKKSKLKRSEYSY